MTGTRGSAEPGPDQPGPEAAGPEGAGLRTEHAAPELTFTVTGADPVRLAAVPTLRFRLGITRVGGGPIRSITLTTVIRIAPARRRYGPAAEDLLAELFGTPRQWGTTMRPLPWVRTTTVVPPFTDSTVEELPVTCGHDVELAATKYLHAVGEGDVPLDFLFSGTIFYTRPDGFLGTAQISWSTDTTFRLPGRLWHELMAERSSWVRLSKDNFERLYAYKTRRALPSWDDVVDALLGDGGEHRDPGTHRCASEQKEDGDPHA